MNPHPLRLLSLMVLSAVASAPVIRAADAASVRFQAVCFDPRESTTPEFYIGGEKGARKPLDLDKSRLSETQEAPVRPGRMVDFYLTKEPRKDEKPAVTVTLPEVFTGQILLVFAPSGAVYQAWAIPLPPDDFPAGGTLVVNVAPVEIAIRAGDSKAVSVPPSKHRFIKAPAGTKDDMMPVQIYQKSAAEDPWKIAQSTRWAVDPRFRSYVFFYQPGNGRLMLHGITERVDSFRNTKG